MRNVVIVSFTLLLLLLLFSATKTTKSKALKSKSHSVYEHIWPEIEFGWRIIVGTLIGIFGASFGSVGGVGGGGIFVPMLILIIGFDPKSATAISKCMVTGAAISTVFFNLKLKHPTIDAPMIDYDLVLLNQPIIILGISIGVILSVVFSDWMITVLLIIIFIVTSMKALLKGLDTWKKETIIKEEEAARLLESPATSSVEGEYKSLPDGPQNEEIRQGSILSNIRWKKFGLLCFVWFAVLLIHIAMNYTTICSSTYWILTFLQIPVTVGVSLYQAVGLYQGKKITASKRDHGAHWPLHLLILCGFCSLLAGTLGGLLGVGSGFVMGPLFIELGIAPQVASASATLGMTFTASISVVQYYLLNRFPVPYALYLTLVATIAAYIGQKIIDKLINIFQRASLIIFVLSFTIFVSAIALGELLSDPGCAQSKLAKLDFVPLDIIGKNYLSWVLDVEIHLDTNGLGDTIREGNKASNQDKVKPMIFPVIIFMKDSKLNEFLMKNYEARPSDIGLFPKANETKYDHHIDAQACGRNFGCDREHGCSGISKNTFTHQKWKNNEKEKSGQNSKQDENNCYHCGGKDHWSRQNILLIFTKYHRKIIEKK